MEEIFQRKDEQRQKKLKEGLQALKLDKYSQNNNNDSNSNSNNENNDYINNNNIENNNNISLNKNQINKLTLNEQKIKQLNEIILEKDKEIEHLKNINAENIETFKKEKEFAKTITTKELVGKEGYELLKNEEANMITKTMHQTVKVLQEMLKQKTLEINEKSKIIEKLQNELNKSKSVYLQQINILKDQIKDRNKSALDELQKLLDENKIKNEINIKKKEGNNMTLYELEKLLADKDNEIKLLKTELDAARIEIKNYLEKIGNNYTNIKELEEKLHEEELKNKSLIALKNLNHKNFVDQLEEEINVKNAMIEQEKAKIDKLKRDFMEKFEDKVLFNEEQKSQKYAQSVQLNEVENSKEKEDIKKQLKNLKNKNDKLNTENKKLKNAIQDLEKSKNEISLELYKSREDKKTILELQVKDNKKIALLNKEKEKLKKENNKIKGELEKIKLRLNDIEQENEKLSNINNNLEQQLKNRGSIISSSISKIEGPKIDKKNKITNLNQQEQNRFSYQANNILINVDDILNSICKYCMNKKINLKKHLQRYDITKNGKIGQKDFKRGIDELKIGLINYDLEKLVKACKSPKDDEISIENFLNMLNNKNPEFQKFLEDFPDENENLIGYGNKQASRKYDNFENKEFNIDY